MRGVDVFSDTLFLGSSHILSGIVPNNFQTLRTWVAAVLSASTAPPAKGGVWLERLISEVAADGREVV